MHEQKTDQIQDAKRFALKDVVVEKNKVVRIGEYFLEDPPTGRRKFTTDFLRSFCSKNQLTSSGTKKDELIECIVNEFDRNKEAVVIEPEPLPEEEVFDGAGPKQLMKYEKKLELEKERLICEKECTLLRRIEIILSLTKEINSIEAKLIELQNNTNHQVVETLEKEHKRIYHFFWTERNRLMKLYSNEHS